jgi:hypothetical protein
MPADKTALSLFEGLNLAGMNYEQAWLAQVGVGGDAGRLEVEAYILGLLRPDAYHHNVIAQGLNEHFMERGEDHPVGYLDM